MAARRYRRPRGARAWRKRADAQSHRPIVSASCLSSRSGSRTTSRKRSISIGSRKAAAFSNLSMRLGALQFRREAGVLVCPWRRAGRHHFRISADIPVLRDGYRGDADRADRARRGRRSVRRGDHRAYLHRYARYGGRVRAHGDRRSIFQSANEHHEVCSGTVGHGVSRRQIMAINSNRGGLNMLIQHRTFASAVHYRFRLWFHKIGETTC